MLYYDHLVQDLDVAWGTHSLLQSLKMKNMLLLAQEGVDRELMAVVMTMTVLGGE